MARRGNRAAGPQTNTTSVSSGSNEVQWKPQRTHSTSADTSLAKSAKSCDSAQSSPVSGHSTSPPITKKGGGKGRSANDWRAARGAEGGRNGMSDSKFTITSEDFPALPGVRGGNGGTSHSTPSKYVRKEKDGGKHLNADLAVTDDSGVSSTSRGHSPTERMETVPIRNSSSSKAERTHIEKKKSGSTTLAHVDRRKNGSPVKERPPRMHVKQNRISVHQAALGVASPKKKTINANAANTAPSFMKLSKVGQKVPERRGGQRLHNQSPLQAGPTSPTSDDKENSSDKDIELLSTKLEIGVGIHSSPEIEEPKRKTEVVSESVPKTKDEASESPNSAAPSHCIFHPTDVPKIILGPGGEMSNIPPTMLTDQFGMAAMLPILDIVRNRSANIKNTSLTEEQLREKIQNENIEMTTIGFDLNELGVPMKTQDQSPKPVWETFGGPFGNLPLLPTNMSLCQNQVPSVYYTARTLQSTFDMLTNIPEKFGLHELFYIFYNLPKEIWQLNAARELQYRGWRYNIKERLWVLRKLPKQNETEEYSPAAMISHNPFTQPRPNQDDLMIGNFEIYDVEKARICSAEMRLYRSDFEVPPWEQKTLDHYQRMVASVLPKEMLWGPREDRKNHVFIQGMSGMLPNLSGAVRNKLANLTIPKTQHASERRLLSFADSPDVTSNFENPFGNLPAATTTEEIYRQQMLTLLMQKMQQQQQQQQLAASSKLQASSSFSSNHF